jgi:outer membrane protein assembly factor BamB
MRRNPGHGPLRAWVIVLLAGLLAAAGCAPPWVAQPSRRPAPTATPVSPLASETIYWDQGMSLWALRASDARVRWQLHGWSGPLPGCDGCTYTVSPGTPTFDHGALYTLTVNDHASSAVYAFSAVDGSTRWQTPVAGCASSAPLVVDGVVYVSLTGHRSSNFRCGKSGWVYALRASDGQVLWRVPFAEHNVWAPLALANGMLIVANSRDSVSSPMSYLSGLRISDGKVVWRIAHPTDKIEFTASDGVVIAKTTAGIRNNSGLRVEAFRASDGMRLWASAVIPSPDPTYFTTPLLANGMAYIVSGSGDLYSLRASDGHLAWLFQADTQSVGAPVFDHGRLYIGVGPFLDVIDATSGTLLREYPLFDPVWVTSDVRFDWSDPVITPTTIFVSVGAGACFDNPLCGGDPFHGYLYALDTATGKLLWRYKTLDDFGASTPVLGT